MAFASTLNKTNKMIDSNSFLVRRGGYLAGFLRLMQIFMFS